MTLAAGLRAATPGPKAQPKPQPELEAIEPTTLTAPAMGGGLAIHLDAAGRVSADAGRAGRMTIARVLRWADRLTRFTETSDLSALNADPRTVVPVRPTLAAALAAGMLAAETSEGFADITLLDARLAAEDGSTRIVASRLSEWQVLRRHRGSGFVRRPAGVRFDLGGVGKGWVADRALNLLHAWPSAVVDADGDLAVRTAPGKFWEVGIDDPRTPDTHLAVLRLAAPAGGLPKRWGVATSGISVHRWSAGGTITHHLIDPRTGRPAVTDVIQATVVADTALRAEALAKSAVIAGSGEGFALLERARVRGAVLLTSAGDVLALPVTLPLLAP